MNENIIKAIDAIEEAISNENAKIKKMLKMRNDWANRYILKCNGCSNEMLISKFTRIKKYEVDMDSDWHYYGEEHDKFKCPDCSFAENWTNNEIVRLVKFYAIKFTKTEEINGSRW